MICINYYEIEQQPSSQTFLYLLLLTNWYSIYYQKILLKRKDENFGLFFFMQEKMFYVHLTVLPKASHFALHWREPAH